MVTAIGFFHGVEVTKERAIELIATLGAGVGLRELARQVLKLIPGYGQAVSASIAFGGTVALGEAANLWFKSSVSVDVEDLKDVFKATAEYARKEYKRHSEQERVKAKVEGLRKQLESGDLTKEDFARELAELEED